MTSGTNGALTHAIAPGARIRAGRGDTQDFIGIAAILVIDGAQTLLTCGHPPAFGYSNEILAGDEPDGEAIALMSRNMLGDPEPLDAALCPLTDVGKALLKASATAPTLAFATIKTPDPSDNHKEAVFWETHDDDEGAPTAPVVSYCGDNSALFPPGGPSTAFIETSHDVSGGDSGSLLSIGNRLYGLCSGYVGYTSFFTPIANVVSRLLKEGAKCSVYRPA